jgi:hypothetical protein
MMKQRLCNGSGNGGNGACNVDIDADVLRDHG